MKDEFSQIMGFVCKLLLSGNLKGENHLVMKGAGHRGFKIEVKQSHVAQEQVVLKEEPSKEEEEIFWLNIFVQVCMTST